MWDYSLHFLVLVFAEIGLYIAYRAGAKEAKLSAFLKGLTVAAFVLPVIMFAIECKRQYSADTDAKELRAERDVMTQQFDPVKAVARRNYPALDERAAVEELIADAMKRPTLILVGNTQPQKDPQTGHWVTTYVFRSKYDTLLRDVSATLSWGHEVVSAKGSITGAFVEDSGSRAVLAQDRRSFTFATGCLKEGNDLRITVVSAVFVEGVKYQVSARGP